MQRGLCRAALPYRSGARSGTCRKAAGRTSRHCAGWTSGAEYGIPQRRPGRRTFPVCPAAQRVRERRGRVPRDFYLGQFQEHSVCDCRRARQRDEGDRAYGRKGRRACRGFRRRDQSAADGDVYDPGTASARLSHVVPDAGREIFRVNV